MGATDDTTGGGGNACESSQENILQQETKQEKEEECCDNNVPDHEPPREVLNKEAFETRANHDADVELKQNNFSEGGEQETVENGADSQKVVDKQSDATLKAEQIVAESGQNNTGETLKENGFTEPEDVKKHDSVVIADCVVDAIIGAAFSESRSSSDNIPDVISCTGIRKEEVLVEAETMTEKETSNSEQKGSSELKIEEAVSIEVKNDIAPDIVNKDVKEETLPPKDSSKTEEPLPDTELNNGGMEEVSGNDTTNEDGWVMCEAVEKPDEVDSNEKIKSEEIIAPEVKQESTTPDIQNSNPINVGSDAKEVMPTEEPKHEEVVEKQAENVTDQHNQTETEIAKSEAKNVPDQSMIASVESESSFEKIELSAIEVPKEDVPVIGENVSNADPKVEVSLEQNCTDKAEVSSPSSKEASNDACEVISPVAAKRRSKNNKQAAEDGKPKRDSYQETKQEIKDSLSFIKSKLVKPETESVQCDQPKAAEAVNKEAGQGSKESGTPDYEPISVDDPDPVYESVQESSPSLQETAQKNKPAGKPAERVEIIEKTDLSKSQFTTECIPPLRPARTKKQQKVDVPDWRPPEQNIMSYLCGCFFGKHM